MFFFPLLVSIGSRRQRKVVNEKWEGNKSIFNYEDGVKEVNWVLR